MERFNLSAYFSFSSNFSLINRLCCSVSLKEEQCFCNSEIENGRDRVKMWSRGEFVSLFWTRWCRRTQGNYMPESGETCFLIYNCCRLRCMKSIDMINMGMHIEERRWRQVGNRSIRYLRYVGKGLYGVTIGGLIREEMRVRPCLKFVYCICRVTGSRANNKLITGKQTLTLPKRLKEYVVYVL